MTNMSGGQQTRICRQVTRELRAEFALYDVGAGDQLEQEEMMSVFLSDVIAAARKGMAKAPRLFSSASTYPQRAVAGKKTKKCFTGNLWGHRDSDFDRWLSADQPDADAGAVTVLTPEKDWTFAEAAVSVLNVSPDTPILVLAKLLIKRGHTMPLTRVEAMAEATERGEKTSMVTNNWGNFAFIDNGDPGGENPVSVAHVVRYDDARPWSAYVYVLADSNRWIAGYRLMVCNLDPSKLGL
ncbi:MAG: hypothetical protein P4M11_05755 [Candidatus Pacebacteria bacterium]|nr:hypothetical protein [Candidatus Paceibacterota bacterium]